MKLRILAFVCLLNAAVPVLAQDSVADLLQAGDRDGALALIRAGADVVTPQADGTTALHWAVFHVDPELVRTLLRREASPNAANLFGATPLGEAVKIADPAIVEMLLEAGADADAKNEDGQTALMLAARTGVVEVAELLLDHGADVNAVEEWRGQTALMWAAADARAAMAELLIAHGADVSIRSDAFDWGSQVSSEPRNQYRPPGGLTPLLYAARSGCLACVAAMLEAGADINVPDPVGVTPLMVAIDNSHFDLANYLLEQGANPHAFDWVGRTPLYVAVDINSLQQRQPAGRAPDALTALDIARVLLEAGVYPNPQLNMLRPGRGGNSGRFGDDMLNTGATPLLRAANFHDVEAVRLLLQHGALVDLGNAKGVTPLITAAGMGTGGDGGAAKGREAAAIATIETLLQAGADIDARITDTSSFTAGTGRRSAASDRQGQSALHGAASQGWLEVARYLLDHGADLHAADDQGRTPLDAAMGTAGGRVDRPIEDMVALLKSAESESQPKE